MKYTDINKNIGNISSLEIIYDKNPLLYFEEYNGDYESALHYFAAFGNCEVLDWLYNKVKFDIDLSNKNYETPLGSAVTEGNIGTTMWLLKHNANVNGLENDMISPLMSAVMSGNYEIVKLLIDNGADVNRMHLRTGRLPLDEAKSRGRKNIEELLLKIGAKSHYVIPDWINDKGSGILEYLSLRFEHILPINIPTPLEIGMVQLKLVPVNNRKNRMLFTYGLYDICNPRIELFIVLPEYWNFYNKENSNQFPVLFISKLIQLIQEGKVVNEGDYFFKTNPSFKDLMWEDEIEGFFISDVTWKSKKNIDIVPKMDNNVDTVSLLTLIPVKSTKSGYGKLSIEAARISGWQKLTLPINGKK